VRRVARRGTSGAVRAIRASATALPFADRSFDGLVSCCALEHWPDQAVGVRECIGVVARGGPLVFIEIDGHVERIPSLPFLVATASA